MPAGIHPMRRQPSHPPQKRAGRPPDSGQITTCAGAQSRPLRFTPSICARSPLHDTGTTSPSTMDRCPSPAVAACRRCALSIRKPTRPDQKGVVGPMDFDYHMADRSIPSWRIAVAARADFRLGTIYGSQGFGKYANKGRPSCRWKTIMAAMIASAGAGF